MSDDKILKSARKLLTKALDAIPSYDDGRNDELIDDIEEWLESNPKKEGLEPLGSE